MSNQTDINEIFGDIQSNGKYLGNHPARIKALMEHFAKAKIPLATVADDRHMSRAIGTIKHYCREYEIALVDWVPMCLRPEKPKKTK